MSAPKKALNRPKKRTLVRWDDNLDELLLLTIQSVCNNQCIKIPWSEVAKTMGHNVTEGAIVQHLAKLRNRRVTAGKDVPPPLRRGGAGSSSNISSESKRKRQHTPLLNLNEEESGVIPVIDHSSDEDYAESNLKARRKRKQSSNVRPVKDVQIKSEPESGNDTESDDGDSGEYLVPGATFLEFPNDRYAVESSPSVPDSKIVVLKYRNTSGHVSRHVPLTPERLESTPTSLYTGHGYNAGLYQQSPISRPSQSISDWGNRPVLSGAYMTAPRPTEPTLYEPEYTLSSLRDLGTHNETHGLPSIVSPWEYHHNTFSRHDASEMAGYTEGFFDDQYQYPFNG
ncbi:hypothetical protein BDV59DRAFT_79809 [Aspergillus ambiguus]|uniref:uncharacterized protein n=1 Tax=Aspergillus ambiguus TaxID=176160 RepID=UPI003CCE3036